MTSVEELHRRPELTGCRGARSPCISHRPVDLLPAIDKTAQRITLPEFTERLRDRGFEAKAIRVSVAALARRQLAYYDRLATPAGSGSLWRQRIATIQSGVSCT
ncbi:hypothetical protein ACL02T_09860 [Pseudonocardia sp. RS010]|uniref:hypothetical protein n=1 Tax=Pseudonocardia sp. RS010 TaxID=3385979 RepID=UPI0039A38A0F